MAKSGLAATLALIATIGAVGSPVAAQDRTPGVRPALSSDEGGLWGAVDKAEQQAKASGERNTDEALNAYVTGVTCKVAGDYCPEVRVYVMDRPFFNATMAPNGYTEIWSGALLRANNEAELGFILGHEVTHYAENHSVERMRATRNRSNAMFAVSVGLAVVGASAAVGSVNPGSIMDATRGLIDVVYMAGIASMFGFSRENELEADRVAPARVVRAGLDPTAGITLWESIVGETAASDFDRVRRSGGETNIFDSHPVSKDRIEALKKNPEVQSGGDLGRDRYRAAIRPHLSRWLRDDLRRRDYGQTLFLIDRLASNGEDLGILDFYKGETYRLRRKEGDLDRARDAYLAAAAHPDAPAAVWRELGEVRRKSDDKAGAKVAFETYLAKAPEAEDAWLVRDTLKTLN